MSNSKTQSNQPPISVDVIILKDDENKSWKLGIIN